jgi:beta-galactosidase
MEAVRRLDKLRPITSAVDKSPTTATVFDELDIVGINYNLGLYDEVHEKYPEKAIFSSENCATGTTRAWYAPDCKERGYIYAFDRDTNSWFRGREHTWNFIADRDWIMGGYQWAAFEHRGETVWPRLCSQSGAIDLFLQKKDAFYQNQSHWSDIPMIHMLPHWNVDVYDDEPVSVWVYTNCEEAELILNGKSLGRKAVEKNKHLEWNVDYEPGRIEAIGYVDGKPCVTDVNETAGAPAKLMLRLENRVQSVNDVAIISCYAVDSEGRMVPNAAPTVEFATNTLGRIISTGSDICDHSPINSPIRKMREGYISVAVGVSLDRGAPTAKEGVIELYARSQGLQSARIKIKI